MCGWQFFPSAPWRDHATLTCLEGSCWEVCRQVHRSPFVHYLFLYPSRFEDPLSKVLTLESLTWVLGVGLVEFSLAGDFWSSSRVVSLSLGVKSLLLFFLATPHISLTCANLSASSITQTLTLSVLPQWALSFQLCIFKYSFKSLILLFDLFY